jgi:hypothetical protein
MQLRVTMTNTSFFYVLGLISHSHPEAHSCSVKRAPFFGGSKPLGDPTVPPMAALHPDTSSGIVVFRLFTLSDPANCQHVEAGRGSPMYYLRSAVVPFSSQHMSASTSEQFYESDTSEELDLSSSKDVAKANELKVSNHMYLLSRSLLNTNNPAETTGRGRQVESREQGPQELGCSEAQPSQQRRVVSFRCNAQRRRGDSS